LTYSWLVTYRDGIPARKRSPIQVHTHTHTQRERDRERDHVTSVTMGRIFLCFAAAPSAKGRIAAATYGITFAYAEYPLFFTMGREMPPPKNCQFP